MKKLTFEPQGNYIVAKVVNDRDNITAGGIVLPETSQDRPQFCRAIAVGPGLRSLLTDELIPTPVKAGDLLCVNRQAYQMVEMPDKEKYAFFGYGDVFCILRENEVDD